MLIKTYTGARLDLEHYKGYEIANFAFEVLNDDDSPYAFPLGTTAHFKLFAKKGGTLLADITLGFDSPATNFIYLTDSSSIMTLRSPRIMWHEVYSIENNVNKLLFEGVSAI